MLSSRFAVLVSSLLLPALAFCGDPPTLSLHIDPLGPAGEALGFEAGAIAWNLGQNLTDAGLPNATVTADCTFRTPGRTQLSKVATQPPQLGSGADLKHQVIDLTEAHRKDQAAMADLQARFRKLGADPGQIADMQAKISQLTFDNQKLTTDLGRAQQAPQTPAGDIAAQLLAMTAERDKLKHQADEDAVIRDELAKARESTADLAEVRRQATALQRQKDFLQQELSKASEQASRTLTAESETRDLKASLQSANKAIRDREAELAAQSKRADQAEQSARNDEALVKDLGVRLQAANDKLNQANATLAGMAKGRWP